MITPVILAGGAGTRLWPLSRKSFPKQFAAFDGDQSLFQQTVTRLSGAGMGRPMVLTSEDFRFIVTEQLGQAGVFPEQVFIEPEGRDTAPAILLAAMAIADGMGDGLILLFFLNFDPAKPILAHGKTKNFKTQNETPAGFLIRQVHLSRQLGHFHFGRPPVFQFPF